MENKGNNGHNDDNWSPREDHGYDRGSDPDWNEKIRKDLERQRKKREGNEDDSSEESSNNKVHDIRSRRYRISSSDAGIDIKKARNYLFDVCELRDGEAVYPYESKHLPDLENDLKKMKEFGFNVTASYCGDHKDLREGHERDIGFLIDELNIEEKMIDEMTKASQEYKQTYLF